MRCFNLLVLIGWCACAGCATAPPTRYSTVLEGMSRNNLRFYFGEPLRIEPGPSGGENWYYRFSSWHANPTGAAETSDDFGQRTSSASLVVEVSKQIVELPVHLSSDGFVVPPIPHGKVVKN